MVKFSITIPAYKTVFLKEALDSCLSQTYPEFEVVVVDDCSPNDIQSIVAQFDDSRLKYYRNKKNCGAVNVVDNWNICLGYAKGDYIICMGDDDKLLPNCLEDYMFIIKKYPGLAVYHSWAQIIDNKSNIIALQSHRPEWETGLSFLWHRWNNRTRQYIGDFCYEIKQLRAVGGFYKLPLAWASDDITAVRAATLLGIANTQTPGFQYRVNPYTISESNNVSYKIKAVISEREWFKDFLTTYHRCNTFEGLSSLDKLYLGLLENQLYDHFDNKLKGLCIEDVSFNFKRVFWWFKNREQYNLSINQLIVSVVSALWIKRKKKR